MNTLLSLIILAASFLPIQSMYSNLPSGVSIATGHHQQTSIENLKQNDRILSFDPSTGTFPTVTIQAAHTSRTQETYRITTPNGIITATGNQPFFDLVRKQFVPARAWTTAHVFVDQQLMPVETTSITCIPQNEQCHELYLSPHHIFFASDARVMTHNNPLILYTAVRIAGLIAQALPEIIAGFMAVEHIHAVGSAKFPASPALASQPQQIMPAIAATPVKALAPPVTPQAPISLVRQNIPQASSIISSATNKALTKIHPAVMPHAPSMPLQQTAESSQTISRTVTIESTPSFAAAIANNTPAITVNSFPLKDALLQAALPAALFGGTLLYGIHCQEVRNHRNLALEHEHEMSTHAHKTIEQHKQKIDAEALKAGVNPDEFYYFGRFDAYRFPEYLQLLKSNPTYDQSILTLRDLLGKKYDALTDEEYKLVEHVAGIKKSTSLLSTIKKWFTPIRPCGELLDEQYSSQNGYVFSHEGHNLTLSQLIKLLAHEVDSKHLKILERNLATFFDSHEPTSHWKELTDIVNSPNACMTEFDDTVIAPATDTDAPLIENTPPCGATADTTIPTPPTTPCNGNAATIEPSTPNCNDPNDDTTKSSPCAWDAHQAPPINSAEQEKGTDEASLEASNNGHLNEPDFSDTEPGKTRGQIINDKGKAFEDFLVEKLRGKGSFEIVSKRDGTREFDGAVGDVWYEAKAGKYWDMLLQDKKKLVKFGDDMLRGQRIARENGATYELHSQSSIPDTIKKWLTKNKITFHEWK